MFRQTCNLASIISLLFLPVILLFWARSYRGARNVVIKEASFKVFAQEISFSDYDGEFMVIMDKGAPMPWILAAGYSNLLTLAACSAFLFWKMPVWRVSRRYRRHASAGLCHECGYDIRATPERCPECGAIAAELSLSILAQKSVWERVQKMMLALIAACFALLIVFDLTPNSEISAVGIEITRIATMIIVLMVILGLASVIDRAARKLKSNKTR